jgi:glucose dehydrogenase
MHFICRSAAGPETGAVILARLLAAAAALAAAAPAFAEPAERTTSAVVYGSDPCPKAADGEIVVCARRPENDRYRIPKDLRDENRPLSEVAWGARHQLLEDEARVNLPGSCSAVGSGGQSGCHQQLVDQWYAERRARRR